MIPLRAIPLITFNPTLLGLSMLPIACSIVTLSIVLYAIMAGVGTWLTSIMTGWLSHYSGAALVVVSIIIVMAFLFFTINSLTFITSLFASPFNDLLANATETALGETKIKQSFFHLVIVFFLDLRKTVLTVFFSILFGLGLLLPGVGILFIIGIAFLNTFTFITYPQSRRKHGVRESLSWMVEHRALSLGFGLATTLVFSIPVINLFALPLSVVGGTMLFLSPSYKTALR